MARAGSAKTSGSKQSSSKIFTRPILQFTEAYEKEVFFTLAAGTSIFFLTALYSYNPLDASLLAQSFPPAEPTNLAGTLGANISGVAYFTFGLIAWLVPAPFLTSAILCLRDKAAPTPKGRWLGWMLILATLAAIITAVHPVFQLADFELVSGGVLGSFLSEFLTYWLGSIGSFIVLGTGLCISVMLVTRRAFVVPMFRTLEDVATKLPTSEKSPSSSATLQRTKEAKGPRGPFWWDRLLARKPAMESPENLSVTTDNLLFEPAILADSNQRLNQTAIAVQPDRSIEFEDSLPHLLAPDTRNEPRSSPTIELASPSPYCPPPTSVFQKSEPKSAKVNTKELDKVAALLVKTLEDFGVCGQVIGFQPGPVVTVYEYRPEAGIKQSKITGLIDDLALALRVDSIFILPVRGKRALGIQVPNTTREKVHLGDVVSTREFSDADSPLTFGMGKTINGQVMCADLASMPHLLAAGATGSGKSVAINALLCSIIMKAKPEEVRMILVDPKMLELSVYEGIPHLLMPVITEPDRASLALKWATCEMENRYKLMQLACVRNIAGFNSFWEKATEQKRDEIRSAMNDQSIGKLSFILLVIDELADLMLTAPKDVENSIQRLAQKARASGIHMVLATQRPSVDVITGVIKANLPCRVAFQVVSKHDSRTILDLIGAEKLLGKGDMLLQRPGIGRLERIQGALITDEEVLNMVAEVKASSGPCTYDDKIIHWIDEESARQNDSGKGGDTATLDDDPKWDDAIGIGQNHGHVSASFLQRHLKIGYNRAARIVESMETQGLVAKADGAKPRKWLGPQGH